MKRFQLVVGFLIVTIAGVAACGGGSSPQATAEGKAPAATAAPEAAATPAAEPLDTAKFATVLPEGWQIAADDLESMGMMTLTRKNSGDKGVYLKFEGNGAWDGDPMQEMTAFAEKQGGTPAESVTINGIDWATTSYTAYGTAQIMMVTKHNGTKVTATILGDGYGQEPGVTAILDAMQLK